MTTAKISLVITVLNEMATIKPLLEAVAGQTTLPHETIIVDGGSADGTSEWLRSVVTEYRAIGLRVFSVVGNRSLGRNYAIKKASYEWIAITDAGCIPHRDWLEKLKAEVITYQLKNTFVEGLVVAGYYDAQPKTAFQAAVVPYVLVMPDQVNPHTFLPATRSMLLPKRLWAELGGFAEHLSDNEDYDFARRLKEFAQRTNQSGYELPIEIVFARQAMVTWLPRSSLRSFWWMIYRFARGDAQAGLFRPKVLAIFGRYGLMGVLAVYWAGSSQWWQLFGITSTALGLYTLWSISKNYRYAPAGWFWLPVLQLTSDLAVMAGTVSGLGRRFAFKSSN